MKVFFAQALPLLPRIMGVVNITPDSFSDGGRFFDAAAAISHAEKLIRQGADIIDLGAESSAPGSKAVATAEEWARLQPVLEAVARMPVTVSVDTWKAAIAAKAIASGALIINDVTGGRGDPDIWHIIKDSACQLVVMYNKDKSARTTLARVAYTDPIRQIREFFDQALETAAAHGIDPQRIILDPGMGAFLSADPKISFVVLNRLHELKKAFPHNALLVGTSRKGFLRETSPGRKPDERLIGSVISALAAAQRGAAILRVHDVRETLEALRTDLAIEHAGFSPPDRGVYFTPS